jgi:dihydroorotase (multifunctional complex type)
MAELDLAVRGATIVTSAGLRRGDIGAAGGRIVQIGSVGDAVREVDASGLYVLAGGVDTHVHLMDPGEPEREDFPTGTAAAAAAGVTTIIEHSHGRPVRTPRDLAEKVSYLDGRSLVDFGLAAHAWVGESAQVEDLWAAGAAFFKVFTCTTHGIPGHDAAALRTHLRATAAVGAVSLLHCEDDSLTADAERILRSEGRTDGGVLPDWRSRDAEVVAAAVASLLVRRTGAQATIAHVSHPEVAEYLQAERSRGGRINGEACPQYFLLRENEGLELGPLRKFTPPARARIDRDEEQMWDLLRRGVLTHMSSDHAPSTLAQKHDGDIWKVHFGLPGLDSTMAILLDAAARGMLSYEDVTRVYSETPAAIYGLRTKGRIAVGLDADLVLVDPNAQRQLRNEDIISRAGWTPFDGRRVTGRVEATYVRGQLVAENGKPVGDHLGKFLPGAGASKN